MYKKIYIIGAPGGGKTTLALNMSKKYGIDNYELDKIVWDDEAGNMKRADNEINELFEEILKKKSWIVEDVGREIFSLAIKKADIVYYLNLPRCTVYGRCIGRWFKQLLGIEKYNYKPTLKGLFEMLMWARNDLNNSDEKIKKIIENSKRYKVLSRKDIRCLEFK